MRAATRGLRLFIMKGIHRSVLALPLSTQFFHTGPPSLPLVPCLLSVPLLSLFNIFFFLNPLWSKGGTECVKREREKVNRERTSVAEGADLQDSLETSVGPSLSLLLPPVPSTGRAHAHESAYCTWASAELCWVGRGRVGEHRRPQHLFSSQTICSVRPSSPVGLQRTHTHTQNTHPPTAKPSQSCGKTVDEA